ncbi:MAG: DNA polymerase I [Patescibacteria group bacterium]
MTNKKQRLVIVDSNALIHRAFHALPPLSNKEGQLTNAVYGFTMILIKAIKDLKPDYLAACFDLKGKTFRHEAYDQYKATRIKQPDELYQQIPIVKEVLEAFKIPVFEKEGLEADDLIGTIAHLKSVDRPDIETIIVTGDQDTLQLVDYNTKVLTPHKGMSETILYGEDEVKGKFGGLEPKQLIDYKGLRGDASDNIPGVRGIGEKGAIELLREFGSVENVYKNIKSKKIKERTRELLLANKDTALLSKRLATIVLDAPIKFELENCRFSGFDKNAVVDIFQKLNFKRLLAQLATLLKNDPATTIGQGNLFSQMSFRGVQSLHRLDDVGLPAGKAGIPSNIEKDGIAAVAPLPRNDNKKIGRQNYQLVDEEKTAKKFLTELKRQREFCFDTETTGLDPFQNKLLGISFCWQEGEASYLTVRIIKNNLKELKKIFENKNVKKIGHNLKYDIEILEKSGLKTNRLHFDTMIASYVLNPGGRQHNLDTLAFVELGYQMQPIEELIGKGRGQISMAEVPIDKVCWYSCEDADLTFRLYQKLKQELGEQGTEGLLENLEMPLVEVLATIETNGVKINDKILKKLSDDFAKKISAIEKNTWKLVGEKFNLASPLQLKQILFKKLKIDGAGLAKTKTGISTGAAELEKLAAWFRENKADEKKLKVINLLLEFRELSKLKSTYLDALPALINKVDGRVHTSFNQTVTATGRLSSSEPNLQNIPIRTETGGPIRRAFIAERGYKIMKADYSQIELRIVASLANDKKMLKIFESGGDIHTSTAAFIHGIKPEEVTKEIRRTAKEVNFGVLYGMGAWGLSQRTGISNTEAQKFISKYFSTFKEVKKWLDETIELAKERGYVETLYGRRRYLPEINSGVSQVRSGAERMAVNMPIQGTAADLIKLAMIKIHKNLPHISPKAKIILQVHDELVFEVPEKDIKKVAKFVREKMSSVIRLRAPIEVEVSAGDNWGETREINL